MSTNQNKNRKNSYFMNLALEQAKINLGNTKENPSVGCVIIKKNSLIAAGHTSFNGRPHAEYNAINQCRESLKNSILYVTLEPCSHYGKTPPCVYKIVKNNINKVHFSIKDPDLRSFNKSSKILKKFNISSTKGISHKVVKKFYKSYILFKENRYPYVTCKLAVSKDFFTINKRKKWITNYYSRARVHLMRSTHDVILTSSKTINTDNPMLNCRISGLEKTTPSRVVLDNHLRISLSSKVIKNCKKYKTFIFYNKVNSKKINLLNKLGVKAYKIPTNSNNDLDLKKILEKIKELGFSRIFLESGIKLASNFLRENLVNDLKIFVSSKKLKKDGHGSMKKHFNFFLKKKKYCVEKVNLFGEKLISYKLK